MHGPGEVLTQAAARFGDKVALVTATRTMTFHELHDESDRVAAAQLARGLRPGQAVSLYAQNRWEWVVGYHGALKAGAVVNPVNVMLTTEELAFVLRDCGAAAVLTSAEQAAAVVALAADLAEPVTVVVAFGDAPDGAVPFAELPAAEGPPPAHEPDLDSPCTIGYTSGTTGHPKGAAQSHRAVLLNCGLTATMHGRTSADVVVTALPAPHVYGNVVINGTFLVGGTVVLMERFDPAAALRLIEQHRATMFEGVPAMYATMLASPTLAATDLSSLTRCTVGGQTLPISTIERWQDRSGGTADRAVGHDRDRRPRHHPRAARATGTGLDRRVPPGCGDPHRRPDRPVPRGPERRTRRADDPRPDRHARLPRQPGGHGRDDRAGRLAAHRRHRHDGRHRHVFVVDRRKDMIITGGYNVYPAEIERVLAAHPAVAMVAAGPVPDAVKGELACAYVVLAPGATATGEGLVTFAGGSLAAYKRPRVVRFVDDLPKTSTGKIMRRELIKIFHRLTPDPPSNTSDARRLTTK